MTTEERLAAIEARLETYDAMIRRLVEFAAQHPIGRQVLKRMGREGVK